MNLGGSAVQALRFAAGTHFHLILSLQLRAPLPLFTNFASRAGSAAQSLWEASGELVQPTLRLGVTGLARSGKTVFTTAAVCIT